MPHLSTKTYGHNIGLACVFRQPNADHSHCHLLHGYSLQFTFTYGCDELDNKNREVDFCGLKPLKAWLEDKFDHKLALDVNDPHMDKFKELEELEINLDNLSNKEMHQSLQVIISRGWANISSMFGKQKKRKLTKEEVQEHFNAMLNVVPMTRPKRKND